MSQSERIRRGATPFRRRLLSLVPPLIGGLIGWQVAQMVMSGNLKMNPGAVVTAFTLGLLLQILVHEAGHVLAGLRAGLRLVMLAVGPLHYQPGRGVGWKPSPLLGFAVLLPPPGLPLPQITARFRQMVVGGPAAGFAFSALCAGLALILPGSGLRDFFAVTAVLGGVLNLLSVVPMASGVVLNDGARYRRLRPGAPHAQAEAALVALIGLARVQRPREWPSELLAAAQQPHGAPTFDASARSLAAAQAIDTGDLERAAELQYQASELVSELAPALRAGFGAEEAYLLALRGQATEARAQFGRLPRSAFLPQVTRLRVEAAVLLAEGRPDEARTALDRARLDLDSPLASRALEAAWLGELDTRLLSPTD